MPARQNGHLNQMTAEWHGVDWIYRRACVVAAMCWNEVAISTIIQYTALQVAGDWAHIQIYMVSCGPHIMSVAQTFSDPYDCTMQKTCQTN